MELPIEALDFLHVRSTQGDSKLSIVLVEFEKIGVRQPLARSCRQSSCEYCVGPIDVFDIPFAHPGNPESAIRTSIDHALV